MIRRASYATVERLLAGDATALDELDVIVERTCGHQYPWLHRVGDVDLGGRVFRVLRCAACNEHLDVAELDIPAGAPGVPLALRGERLVAWIRAEAKSPAKDEIDWTEWLASAKRG